MGGLKGWLTEDVGTPKKTSVTLDAIEQNDSIYKGYDSRGTARFSGIKDDYRRSVTRKVAFIAGCVVATVLLVAVVITYGNYPIEFTEVYSILWNHMIHGAPDQMEDPVGFIEDNVVWSQRLPRVIAAVIAGAGLAISGTVMQSVLKNPMADSYTTGVSSGAAFGATISIVGGFTLVSYEFSLLVNAFIFALVPTMMMVLVSRARSMSSTSMILAGLAIMYIFNALTTALRLFADPDALASLYRWQVGTLNNMAWDDIPVMLAVTVVGSAVLYALAGRIDVLASGDENARSLGVNPDHMRVLCLAVVSLITASVVSFTGTIGFVGLVAPHIARIFIGSNSRYLMPASLLFGGLLMLAADFIGRTIIAPSVLEVGVVTAFIGGPIFLYLIMRQRKEVWT